MTRRLLNLPLPAIRPRGSQRGRSDDRLRELAGFGTNPGALRARTHLPANLPRSAPLVVVLHGCTQTAAGYDHGSGWSRVADLGGFGLLFPEQRRENNPNLCFNWFVPDDIRRDNGEAASIRQMIAAMIESHSIDAERIFVTGLSAGGAMAAVMLATYPEVFAGGSVIAGLPYACAANVPQALKRMRGEGSPNASLLADRLRQASGHRGGWPTLAVWHGAADATVHPSNAEATLAQWRAVHGLGEQPDRSEIDASVSRRVWHAADGRAVLKAYTIAGMGHGTPLNTSGLDSCGVAGPFMLDVGISSTCHDARSWGLLDPATVVDTGSKREKAAWPAGDGTGKPTLSQLDPQGLLRPGHTNGTSSAIGGVIENALRKAGLMR
ncbi:extracellular catalytic domain type 1 short-chain-length polyhydroxyalkanoate depolymerase [Aureimonas leprariae]|uniref:PHB depolymerase family esterase n=1 Tax=Plantimonas leprariae TaxID=2615207 RepID=A0A7V7PSI4_9HYPH|nr:PHB depolymerase family esterase [Aureimonas leprariae]KAB0682062.1 PHB depolymerase family esterase [Aureimonas leprariae]